MRVGSRARSGVPMPDRSRPPEGSMPRFWPPQGLAGHRTSSKAVPAGPFTSTGPVRSHPPAPRRLATGVATGRPRSARAGPRGRGWRTSSPPCRRARADGPSRSPPAPAPSPPPALHRISQRLPHLPKNRPVPRMIRGTEQAFAGESKSAAKVALSYVRLPQTGRTFGARSHPVSPGERPVEAAHDAVGSRRASGSSRLSAGSCPRRFGVDSHASQHLNELLEAS